ncbi:MAG: TonB-dependent receptor plug domain-containing protein [Betaproteobacteria bacterium]|nr:TonB-dependent receptor plug domain-containing protein [Betaproteobacteria bacterium]
MALLGLAAQALAQTAEQRVTITGSSIKRVQTEGALPVQTVTRQEIDRAGIVSAEQLVARITANGTGADNLSANVGIQLGTTDRNNNGNSSANLRGLGSSSTLVLLNGRRVAAHGLNGGVVDLNSIPMAAVDRIEILKDGASAIYGTDAIGGVINFILRKDYAGLEATAFADVTEAGGGHIYRGSLLGGWGDLAKDRFNVMAALTLDRQERPGRRRPRFLQRLPARTRALARHRRHTLRHPDRLVRHRPRLHLHVADHRRADLQPRQPAELPGPVRPAARHVAVPVRAVGEPGFPLRLRLRLRRLGAPDPADRAHQPGGARQLRGQRRHHLVRRIHRLALGGHQAVRALPDHHHRRHCCGAVPGGRAVLPRPVGLHPQLRRHEEDRLPLPLRHLRRPHDRDHHRRLPAAVGRRGVVFGDWDYKLGLSTAQSKAESTLGQGYLFTDAMVAALGSGIVNPWLLPGQVQTPEALALMRKASAEGARLFDGQLHAGAVRRHALGRTHETARGRR